MLNDASSVMLRIKPIVRLLGYKEQFDSSDLSKYIRDFSFEGDSSYGNEYNQIENESYDVCTNKEKLKCSIQVV